MKKSLGIARYSITLALGVAIGGLVLIAVVAILVTQFIASRNSVIASEYGSSPVQQAALQIRRTGSPARKRGMNTCSARVWNSALSRKK